jgi:hypothetical protein
VAVAIDAIDDLRLADAPFALAAFPSVILSSVRRLDQFSLQEQWHAPGARVFSAPFEARRPTLSAAPPRYTEKHERRKQLMVCELAFYGYRYKNMLDAVFFKGVMLRRNAETGIGPSKHQAPSAAEPRTTGSRSWSDAGNDQQGRARRSPAVA